MAMASRGKMARRASYLLVLGALGLACLAAVPGATATPATDKVTIVPPAVLALKAWTAATSNTTPMQGTIELNGKPVVGVRVRVDNYLIPKPTDVYGHFTYLVDDTLLQRHVVTVADASHATVAGKPLTSEQQAALAATPSAITVAYPISNVKVSKNAAGDPVVTGRIMNGDGTPPPKVSLLTYSLSGTVTDSNGKPVAGAIVSTRTVDRDYWTVSSYTDKHGHYTSLFTASDEEGHNPVPFTVKVAVGNDTYQFLPAEYVYFKALESSVLNLQLPPQGFPMALPLPKSFPGAIYTGTVVGATTANGKVIRPVKATWTDANGGFSLTLPHSYAGKSVSLWEDSTDLFSVKPATPGGPVDLLNWPRALAPNVARNLATVKLS
jgi:hypothetical protein